MDTKQKKTDRRVRKTEAQLKLGLVRLMQLKSIREITVKELVEEVDINRSTFYLHYTDIFQMLDILEEDLASDFRECLDSISENHSSNEEKALDFLENLYILFDNNRELCKALLGPNGDPAFCVKIQNLVGETVQTHINQIFPKDFNDASLVHSFAMSGTFGLITDWINTPKEKCPTPEHMAKVTFLMLSASLKATY